MKQLKSFMLLLSISLIVGAVIVGSCSAQESMNYLKVKGQIFDNHEASITVYAQDEYSDQWTKIAKKKVHTKYKLRLATDVNYQIFFTSNEGQTKVVHIQSGEPGMYIEYIDIDFNGSNERHACMYQDGEYYKFQTKLEYYSMTNQD